MRRRRQRADVVLDFQDEEMNEGRRKLVRYAAEEMSREVDERTE